MPPGALFHVGPLSPDPLEAAADFHARLLPGIEASLRGGDDPLTLVFLTADHGHAAWRLAAVQALARRFAPSRVNAVETDDPIALAAASAWLARARAITGQLLRLDGNRASQMLYTDQ